MLNLGLRYNPHNERHYSEDTEHSIKKEVVKTGRCLKHQDISITMFAGLITKECKRCAEEYRLNLEIERIKNNIAREKYFNDKLLIKEENIICFKNTSEIGTQTELVTNEIETQTELVTNEIETQTELVTNEIETQTELVTNEIKTQTKLVTNEIEIQPEINIQTKRVLKKKIINVNEPIKELFPFTEPKLLAEKECDIDYFKVQFILYEGKQLEHSWIPTSKLLTKKWLKYKIIGLSKNASLNYKTFPGNIPKNIDPNNLDKTEYFNEIDKISYIQHNSHNFYNGAYIMNDHQGFVQPSYKIINTELIKHHENKSYDKMSWYDINFNKSTQILRLFIELKQNLRTVF